MEKLTMEPLMIEPRKLNLTDGWEEQVNGKAKRVYDRLEKEKKCRAEEEKRNKAMKRTNRIMCLFYIGFGLLAACGIYLGYAEEVPMGISVAVTMAYVALLSYTVGFIGGRKKHR